MDVIYLVCPRQRSWGEIVDIFGIGAAKDTPPGTASEVFGFNLESLGLLRDFGQEAKQQTSLVTVYEDYGMAIELPLIHVYDIERAEDLAAAYHRAAWRVDVVYAKERIHIQGEGVSYDRFARLARPEWNILGEVGEKRVGRVLLAFSECGTGYKVTVSDLEGRFFPVTLGELGETKVFPGASSAMLAAEKYGLDPQWRDRNMPPRGGAA